MNSSGPADIPIQAEVRRFAPPSLVALALLTCFALPAEAKPSDFLWATVNACDTEKHPNAMGLRASMPGNGSRQRMYMRFTAQFWDGEARRWTRVPGEGRSEWVRVGSALVRARQAGWTFTIGQPPAGATFKLRGRVDFRWKKREKREGKPDRWVTVKRRHRFTTKDREGVSGGDPPGSSEARCRIS